MKRVLFIVVALIIMTSSTLASTPAVNEKEFHFKYALKFHGVGYVDLPDNLLPKTEDEDRTIVLVMRVPDQKKAAYKYHNDIVRGNINFGISTSGEYNTDQKLMLFCDPYNHGKQKRLWLKIQKDKVVMLVVSFDYDASAERTNVSAYLNTKNVLNTEIDGKFKQLTGDFRLGNGWAGGLYGTVYALYIYNRPLSEDERKQIFNTPYAPPHDGLLAWYMPDSVDIDTLKWVDLSGNKNDARIIAVKTTDLFDEYKRAKTAEEKQMIARLLPPSTSAEGLLAKLRSFFVRFGLWIIWPVVNYS